MAIRFAKLMFLTLAAALLVSVTSGVAMAAKRPFKAPMRPGAHPRHPVAHRPRGARLPRRNNRGEIEKNEGGSSPSGTGDYMVYRGGWVQEAPRLYIVYWGDWSLANDRYNVQNRLYYFLNGVGGSGWANTLRGYGYNCTVGGIDCPHGTMIRNPSGQFVNYWMDSTDVPVTPTRANLQAEAQRAAAHFGDYGHDAQYVLALPPGHGDYRFVTKGGSLCAWHDWASVSYGDRGVSYTSLPYMPDAGTRCGNYSVNNSILDGVSIIEGHEYAESVTNPYISLTGPSTTEGWDDSTYASGEIGDKCMGVGGYHNAVFSTGAFPVQSLWSNYNRYFYSWGCVFAS